MPSPFAQRLFDESYVCSPSLLKEVFVKVFAFQLSLLTKIKTELQVCWDNKLAPAPFDGLVETIYDQASLSPVFFPSKRYWKLVDDRVMNLIQEFETPELSLSIIPNVDQTPTIDHIGDARLWDKVKGVA